MSKQNRVNILFNDAVELRNFASFYVQETPVAMPHQTPSTRIDHCVIGRRKPCGNPELSERLEVVAEFSCPKVAEIFAEMAKQTAKTI